MQLKWIFIPTLTLLFDENMVFSATDFSLLHSRRSTDNTHKPEPDPFKTLASLNEKKWFLENRTSNTPPPLIGFPASCMEMEVFSVEEDSKTSLMLLYYKDSDNLRQSELLNVTAKTSASGSPVLEFRFEDPINPNLTGRAVEYLVIRTDFISCYVLQTSTNTECTFWILNTADDGKTPKQCTPPKSPDCVKEVYGRHETTQCSDSNTVDVSTRKPENPIAPSDSTTPSSLTTPSSPTTPSRPTTPSQTNNLLSEFKNKNIYLRYKSSTSDLYLLGFPATCVKMEFIETKYETKSAVLTMDYKDSNKEWQTELGNVTLKKKRKSRSLGSLIFWVEESETVTSTRRARYQILRTDGTTCFTLKLGMTQPGKDPECGVWSVDKINTTSVPQVCMEGYKEGCPDVPYDIMSPDGCY
uniref:Putative salivary lipocalin n=1 Tax=Ixodes ricinus TaxID=34613 RepID=A0A6B0VD80_IXORI